MEKKAIKFVKYKESTPVSNQQIAESHVFQMLTLMTKYSMMSCLVNIFMVRLQHPCLFFSDAI